MKLEQIDTSSTAGKIEVMRLAAEGRKVVFRGHPWAAWAEPAGLSWDWSSYDYGIVAELAPKEQWDCVAEIALSDDGYKIGLLGPLRAHRLPLGTKLYVRTSPQPKERPE